MGQINVDCSNGGIEVVDVVVLSDVVESGQVALDQNQLQHVQDEMISKMNSTSQNDSNSDRDSDEGKSKVDRAFAEVIESFKAFFDTLKHSNFDATEKKDRQALFEKIYDKKMERYLNGERAGGYEDVLEEVAGWADNDQFIFRAFRYKRLGPNSFDKYVRFSTDDDELIIQSTIYFDCDTAQVVKMETRRLQRRRKLPGQVPVTCSDGTKRLVWPDLTEREFTKAVYHLPNEVYGQLFLGGIHTPSFGLASPVLEKCEMIHVHMRPYKPFTQSLSLAKPLTCIRQSSRARADETISLYDDRNIPIADGAYWKHIVRRNVLHTNSHRLVLHNHNDEPLCMCASEFKLGEYVYMIYGRQEPYYGKSPHVQEKFDDKLIDFYAWFQIRVSKHEAVRLVYVWHSQNAGTKPGFEPLFKLGVVQSEDGKHSPVSAVHSSSPCTTFALQSYEDESQMYAVISTYGEKNESVTPCSDVLIAPGVDPGMVLAISICLSQSKI
ncbi:hypothetical protein ACA910_000752 [Epithemia clementina (nom. ined.)]